MDTCWTLNGAGSNHLLGVAGHRAGHTGEGVGVGEKEFYEMNAPEFEDANDLKFYGGYLQIR